MTTQADPIPRGPRNALLPPGLKRFLVRRMIEGAGAALVIASLIAALALASFNPADPSLNLATGAAARNLLGGPGALGADLALQSLGWGAVLLTLTGLGWGVRTLAHAGVGHCRARVLALPGAIILVAAALALASDTAGASLLPPGWRVLTGPGGWIGGRLAESLSGLAASAGLPGWAATPAAGAAALGLAGFAAPVRWAEWQALGQRLWRFAHRLLRLLLLILVTMLRAARGIATLAGSLLRRGQPPQSRAHRASRPGRRQSQRPAQPREAQPRETPPRETPPRREDDASVEKTGPLAATPRRPIVKKRRRTPSEQAQLELPIIGGDAIALPALDLLAPPPKSVGVDLSEDALDENARMLESVLEDFGVRGEIVRVSPGPVVTLYELEPARGTKTNRVIGLADDIARSMSAISVRISVVPGQSVIGIELPNAVRETVVLREVLSTREYQRATGLPLALGKDISGRPVIADLERMPHLLIAGTTGSGKSVGINAMILSLLYRLPPETCRFIMIDPKMLELSIYDDIPHLLAPVVTDPKKAVVALKWVVREMESRYQAMSKLGVRKITIYNQRIEEARKRGEILKRRVQTGYDPDTGKPVYEEQPLDATPLPSIVVVVDELADLMLVAGKDVETAIQRLSQMARAAGIHIIMATQRPSVDVVTGVIKANFPTRISFHVTSKIDSRTILGEQGAEQLLGQGDMLYMASGSRATRVHGPFVDEREVEAVVAFLRAQGTPEYNEGITEDESAAGEIPGGGGTEDSGGDTLYDEAVALITREGRVSTSFVQRHLQIGYNRAARIIERMETEGLISGPNRVGRREVLAGSAEEM